MSLFQRLRGILRRSSSRRSPYGLTRTCRDCSADFMLTGIEQSYFLMQGIALPTRCRSCAKKVMPDLLERRSPLL